MSLFYFCKWLSKDCDIVVSGIEKHSQIIEDLKKSRPEFKSEFNIVRGSDENGLSLVIPFLKEDVNGKTILKAFIKTWALAILKDKMELHLKTDELDIKLNKDTIYDHKSLLLDVQYFYFC